MWRGELPTELLTNAGVYIQVILHHQLRCQSRTRSQFIDMTSIALFIASPSAANAL